MLLTENPRPFDRAAIPAPPPAGPAHRGSGRSHLRVVRPPRILIVGGSVTGPVLALLLHQAGFDTVALVDAAPAVHERGGGVLGLRHPALDVLDRLGIDQDEYVTHPSEVIRVIPVHQRRAGAPALHHYPGRNTTWPLLNEAITRRLPAGLLRTGRRVTALTINDNRPLVGFAPTPTPGGGPDGDGDAQAVDLVIFCDGRASIGRRLLDPRRLRYAGYVAHRGQIDAPHSDLTDFCQYEPSGGAQLSLAPIPGGLDWTMYLDTSRADYRDWCGATPTTRVYAPTLARAARERVDQAAAEQLPPDLANLVAATIRRAAAPVLDIAAPTQMVWPRGCGHAVLLADALAPVRPHTGMGANLGIEQAAGLAAVLIQHQRHGADLDAALQALQTRALPGVTAALRAGRGTAARLRLGAT